MHATLARAVASSVMAKWDFQTTRGSSLLTVFVSGLLVLLAVLISVSPIRAEANVEQEVSEILDLIRDAPNWDWKTELSGNELLASDHIWQVARDIEDKPDAAMRALQMALQDDDVLVRRAAVGIMSRLSSTKTRRPLGIPDALIQAFGDRDAMVRRDAAFGLNLIGENAIAVPVFLEALQHPDPVKRLTAAAALLNVREREPVVRALSEALGDPDPKVRAQAVWSLHWSPQRSAEASSMAFSALIGAITDQDVTVRKHSIDLLTYYEDRAGAAIPHVVERLVDKDESSSVRRASAIFLGSVWRDHQDLAVDALIATLDDPNSGVRNNSAYALGQIGPVAKGAVPRLVEMLGSEPETLPRSNAGHALGSIGVASASVISALTEAFWIEGGSVAWGATKGLIGLGPDAVAAAMPTLVEILEEGSDSQRSEVYRALREFDSMISPEAFTVIIGVAEDPNKPEEERKVAIARIIGMIESTSNSKALRTAGMWALIRIAEDTSNAEMLRAGALRRMEHFGHIAVLATPALQKIFETQDGLPQAYAESALYELRTRYR